jgi:glycosyltransferase involved in cell wall biosynthesis
MRIGIVSTLRYDDWGGSEELWFETALDALKQGVAVSVFIPRPCSDHPKWQALRQAGADLFSLPSRDLPQARLLEHADRFSYRLGKYLREHRSWRNFVNTRPDVVLLNEAVSVPDSETVCRMESNPHAPPYVVISHSNHGEIPQDENRREAASFYLKARKVLFVSQANRRATERQILTRLPHAELVRNPVNLQSHDPVDWPAEATTAFASVGRLMVKDKGQDILLEVLSGPQWADRDWRLSIYGSGRDAGYLRELAAFYGLEGKVSFPGQTSDIREVWRTHHALVLPSRFEGLPLVLVEAMICGRPAIATAVAGHPEWIEDGRTGYLAAAAATSCYAEGLERAWRRREDWPAIGAAARAEALARYDPAPGETLLAILRDAARA